ncbi:MAG: TetR/AcrR family transcriptional regulator [Lachnospiraceae bacterium]|nr:TetR/AcrR family transcriptional regulator [Lachnospiraceae bacterium]
MRKGERRKEELLDIAYRMFISKGYENTSVDEIIEKAGIAKGTYYYYFKSKEQMLEEVIGMMIEKEKRSAEEVLDMPLDPIMKTMGIIRSFTPEVDEQTIEEALHSPENIVMHEKVKKRLIEEAVPLLSQVVEEGIKEGLFYCDHIPERVRVLLVVSNEIFNEETFTEGDVLVFMDMMEKMLGANPGSLSAIKSLIGGDNGTKE